MPNQVSSAVTRQTAPIDQAGAVTATASQEAPAFDAAAVTAAGGQYREAVRQVTRSLTEGKIAFQQSRQAAKTEHQPTLLKSRALYQAFAAVTGLVERALRLETGRLTFGFLKQAPFIVQTERALAGSKAVLGKMEALNNWLEKQPASSAEMSDEHKAQLTAKLDELEDTINYEFMSGPDISNLTEAELERFSVFFDMGNAALDMVDEMRSALEPVPAAARDISSGEIQDAIPAQPLAAAPEAAPAGRDAPVLRELQSHAQALHRMQYDVQSLPEALAGVSDGRGRILEDSHAETVRSLEAVKNEFAELGEAIDRLQPQGEKEQAVKAALQAAYAADVSRFNAYRTAVQKNRGGIDRLPARGDNAPTAMAVLSRLAGDGVKLDRIHLDLDAATETHYRSEPSPERPEGPNPRFYHERQQDQLCLKHALNNCLGGEVFTDKDLANSYRNHALVEQREAIQGDPEGFLREYGPLLPGLTLEQLLANPDPAAGVAADSMIEVMTQYTAAEPLTLTEYVRRGNEIGPGMWLLNDHAGRLGLPPNQLNEFNAHQEAELVNFLRDKEADPDTDRMVVGNMSHYMAFRKAADGDWFLLNSNTPAHVRQTPSEYVRENPARQLSTDIKRYQVLTFAGPEFVPTIPTHAGPEFGTMQRV